MSGSIIGFTIARIASSVMLFWALARHPYSYYILLRWVVCGTAGFGVLLAVDSERRGWAWTFGVIALLFNPIIPVHLSREIWAPVDLVAGAILLVSLFTVRWRKTDDRTES